MHTNRRVDPEVGNVIAAAHELGDLLHRYITVHNGIFKSSLRRLVPIPGFLQGDRLPAAFESLRFIEADLARVPHAAHAVASTLIRLLGGVDYRSSPGNIQEAGGYPDATPDSWTGSLQQTFRLASASNSNGQVNAG